MKQAETSSPPDRVPFSPGRVWTIATNTFVEATRQKVFLIVLMVGIAFLLLSRVGSQFTFGDQIKMIKDTCLAVISLIGAFLAIILTSIVIASENENRTIYTILSKPVWRLEFLLGKLGGMLLLLFTCLLIWSLVFAFVLLYVEQSLLREAAAKSTGMLDETGLTTLEQTRLQIQREIRDPNLIKAILLAFFQLTLITTLTLLVSTFSTSMIFTMFISFSLYLIGHLQATAREMWSSQSGLVAKVGLFLVSFLIPDLQSFNLADDIVVGNVITWSHIGKLIGYGSLMSCLVTALAYAVFYYKEI